MTRVYASPRDLLGQEGVRLGPSRWLEIGQGRVDAFAACTGDRLGLTGSCGAPVVQGFFMLSLVGLVLPDLIQIGGFTHAVNAGIDNLRFLAPVPVGRRIRATGDIVAVEERQGAIQLVVRVTIEMEANPEEPAATPACVFESLSRFYPDPAW